jgi:uncharacterized protein
MAQTATKSSNSASGRTGSKTLHGGITQELFVIPHGDDYILYAPFQDALFLVNDAAVSTLRDLKQDPCRLAERNPAFFRRLLDSGVVHEGTRSLDRIPRPQPRDRFDPDGVTLLLTTGCTLRCLYCYSSGGDTPRTMQWDTARRAIDWTVDHVLAKGGTRFFLNLHGGGEVTTAGDLLRRCVEYGRERAKANELDIRVESGLNGVMSSAMLDWVIRNLDGATVSLDGLPDVHDRQRPLAVGGGSFDRVSDTLKEMDARGFVYSIRTTVTRFGLERLADSVEFISGTFGARIIQVEPFFPVGRAVEEGLRPVEPEAFVRAYREARRRARAHGKELKYSGARFDTLSNVFCKACGQSFAVTPDGFVTSCYEVTDPGDSRSDLFFFGRLDADSRFQFDADGLSALSALVVENKPFCKSCFCKWHCAGDCPAKLALSGDPLDPSCNPRCYINRELTKDQLEDRLTDATVNGGSGP